jgi:hypothetical protein
VAKDDPSEATKAISCYGLFVAALERRCGCAWWMACELHNHPLPLVVLPEASSSGQEEGLGVDLWENASWHISKEVREWIASQNREVKDSGCGVRIISCLVPKKKSPWLNSMEPKKWVHGKRKVVEPDGLHTAYELAERICVVFDCPHCEHLFIPENAA